MFGNAKSGVFTYCRLSPPPREQKVAESFSTSLPFVHFAEYFKNTILPRKGG